MLINNEHWDLCFVNPNDNILYVGDGQYTYGVTIPEYRTIFISNSISGELLHRVLCHELSHAEFVSRGLILPIYIEECLADIIADNIVDIGYIARNVHNNLCRYYGKC